jgi:hypothetical protein
MANSDNENLVFLIEKIWVNSLEHESSRAVGYKPIGYEFDEDLVKNFCSGGREYNSKDCWAIFTPLPEYRYTSLKKLDNSHLISKLKNPKIFKY